MASTASEAPQCSLIQRKLYVSTATGSGTVRLRDGNYVSPPITLSAQRHAGGVSATTPR